MEAGRELDALVAEKVMGLIVPEWGEETPCPYCGSEMRYCGTRSRCSTCQEWRHSRYKEYSTDIAAAWEVVEQFAGKAYIGMARSTHFQDWKVVISDRYRTYEVEAETIPLAICLAALRAKGIKDDARS